MGLRHVLLISVDGMHAVDFYKWVTNNPRSSIGRLYLHGIDYPNATTPTPSGGFPGMLAVAAGGTPRTTGVYGEDSYDRTLFPPGSNCTGSPGTEVIYDGTIAQDTSQLISPIDKANLPLTKNSKGQCVEVYPHDFVKASTIFEVVQTSGRRTAWNDNHASYEILAGPSGKGISELYTPEATSKVSNGGTVNGVDLAGALSQCNASNSVGIAADQTYTTCLPAAEAYDDVKVQAVINKIDGFSADGTRLSAVPTILGMSFEELEVAQRLPSGGYTNGIADPTPLLLEAFQHVDFSIGRILTELDSKHFIEKTLVILTAKHGQAPIDPNRVQTENGGPGGPGVVDPRSIVQTADSNVDTVFAPFVNPNDGRSPAVNGHVQTGDVATVWLQDQNNLNVSNVVGVLNDPTNDQAMGATVRPQGSIFSTSITSGTELAETFGDPQSSDALAAARAPNVFVQPDLGVIYTTSPDEIADHGGGASDDINVPLLISNSGIVQHVSIFQPVSTTQVAPTILKALTFDGRKLTAAATEGTTMLPGIVWGPGRYQTGSTINAIDFDSQSHTQIGGPPPYVGHFDDGSSICFNDVYLTDVSAISATIASNKSGGVFSFHIDSPSGKQIGKFTVQSTGGSTTFKTVSIPISSTTGLHTLCVVGDSGSSIANFKDFELVPACVPECTGATCGSDGCGGTCGTCGFNSLCDDPFGQCVTPPTKYSLADPTLPSLIPATAFDAQSGTARGTTTVGSFDANNYVCYYGVDLTGVASLETSLASSTSGGVLSVRVDSPTGPEIGVYTVKSTGGTSTYKTQQIPISVSTVGPHALCIRGESGTAIASFKSFQLSATPVVAKYAVGSTIPAVPPDSQHGTSNASGGFVNHFDTGDYVCYDSVDLTGVSSIVTNLSSTSSRGVVSVHIGSRSGPSIGSFTVLKTGGSSIFTDVSVAIAETPGVVTLCFVGDSGSNIANLNNFSLSSAPVTATYALGATISAVPPDDSQGITTNGTVVSSFDSGDWVCYNGVDLTGVRHVVANASSSSGGGKFSVRLGSSSGPGIGSFTATKTGSSSNFTNYKIGISNSPGVETLCFVGTSGSHIANFQSFLLSP
jgi:hypothetical protein